MDINIYGIYLRLKAWLVVSGSQSVQSHQWINLLMESQLKGLSGVSAWLKGVGRWRDDCVRSVFFLALLILSFPTSCFLRGFFSPAQLRMVAYYLPTHSLSNNRGKWQFSVASRRSGKIHFSPSLPFPINCHSGEKWLTQVLMIGQFCVLLYLNYVPTESGWKH